MNLFRWAFVGPLVRSLARPLARPVALALATALLVACGGGADRTKAQVRVVNASSGYTGLDLRVDNELRQGAVGYGNTDRKSVV